MKLIANYNALGLIVVCRTISFLFFLWRYYLDVTNTTRSTISFHIERTIVPHFTTLSPFYEVIMDKIKGNLATLFSMCAVMLFTWSIFLFVTVLRIIIPLKLRQLLSVALFVEYIPNMTQSNLLDVIRTQSPFKRCLSVTVAATHSFSHYFRMILVLIIISHYWQQVLGTVPV